MRYFLTLFGHELELELVSSRDGTSTARLTRTDGTSTSHSVELTPISGLARVTLRIDHSSHDVFFDPATHRLLLDGTPYDLTIEDERERAAHRAAPHAAKGPVTVRSAMPGIVRALLVKPGDAVAARQPLVILEAMKMENEVRADHAGVVREVAVTAGRPVDKDTVLVVLDPPAPA